MFRIVTEFLETKKRIAAKKHLTKTQRNALWWAYCKVRWWRFWHEKISRTKPTQVSFLGFTVVIDTTGGFYGTFKEVFIEEDYLFDSVPEKTAIIDAGANLGIATLYLTWRFPGREIHSFEAQPETFALLKENVENNTLTKVQVYQQALSDAVGTITMTGDSRAATIDTDMYTYDASASESHEVQAVTLSSVCQTVGAPSFVLKMDIEGSEYVVLKELIKSGMLKQFAVIRFEFHAIPDEPDRLKELTTAFQNAGYEATQVTFGRGMQFIMEVTPHQ